MREKKNGFPSRFEPFMAVRKKKFHTITNACIRLYFGFFFFAPIVVKTRCYRVQYFAPGSIGKFFLTLFAVRVRETLAVSGKQRAKFGFAVPTADFF